MSKENKISIIMAAYNAEKTIQASIQSALAQTYRDFELIVVDDSSKDSTFALAEAVNDPRIQLVSGTNQLGAAGARNLGIAHAKGEWLAFLDSDDLWHEEKLERQIKFNKETGATISYTATAFIDAEGREFGYTLRAKKTLTRKELLRANLMSCSSVMVKRDVMIPFPAGDLHEDYVVWLTILQETGCAYGLDEPLLTYRIAKGSKSSSRVASAKMTYNAYRSVKYGVLPSAFMTLRYAVHSIGKRVKLNFI